MARKAFIKRRSLSKDLNAVRERRAIPGDASAKCRSPEAKVRVGRDNGVAEPKGQGADCRK